MGLFDSIKKAVKKVGEAVGNVAKKVGTTVSKVVAPVTNVVKNVVNSPVGNIVAKVVPGGSLVQGTITKVSDVVSTIAGVNKAVSSSPAKDKPEVSTNVKQTSVPTGATVVSAQKAGSANVVSDQKSSSIWDDIYNVADKVSDYAEDVKKVLSTGETVYVPPAVNVDDELKVFNQPIFVERRV